MVKKVINNPSNFAYKFRIYPDDKQKELIETGFRLNRDVYNFLVSVDIQAKEDAVLSYLQSKYATTITVQKDRKYTNYYDGDEKLDLKLETDLKAYVKKYRTDNKTWFVAQSNPHKNIKGAYRKFLDYISLDVDRFEYKKKVSSNIINGAIESFKSANDKFKKGSGFPKYKSYRDSDQSSNQQIDNSDITIDVIESHENKSQSNYKCKLSIPKIENLDLIVHRQDFFGSTIKKITFSRNSLGEYYVSFAVNKPETIKPEKAPITYENSVGIDSNIGNLTLPDRILNMNKIMDDYNAQLKKLNRAISFKVGSKKGEAKSKGWLRLNKKICKIQALIARKRDYRNHHLAIDILNNTSDTIIFEKLHINGGMTKRTKNETVREKQNTKNKRSMRRNILDMGWYDLQQKVLKKSEKTDRNILFIDPAYTSKTCNNCGHVNKDLTLKDRNCTCPKCGVSYNRDENAAKNIKDKYFKVGVYQEVL